jgi:Phage tail sheath protein subtilisin-like domain/Phage tail sheath C-terminal domain
MTAQWDPTNLPIRPGMYINFNEAALAQISGGDRGIVAMPLFTYTGGTATAKQFYTVENEADAVTLFGSANVKSIKLALQASAAEVLVYTMPASPVDADYTAMREAFEARPFNVFVFPGVTTEAQQNTTLTWCQTNREEGKHFMVVFGGDATTDQDPVEGNANSTRLEDDYAVNVIVGVNISGVNYTSSQYAPYIAGLIASKQINESITYSPMPVDDVTKRLRNSEIKTALQAGSLVLSHDGEKVKVEQGLTTSGKKIRSIRARQAISTDLAKAARDSYIGQISNNEAGQNALISAISAYLETLENEDVLILPDDEDGTPAVQLDPTKESTGDSVFLLISYTEVDSMERIFIDIQL